MAFLVTICARGGSKGIPGKNIRLLNGKPLIAYTIDVAKRFATKYNAVIGLSSDSDAILACAKQYGLNTEYRRPEALATDKAGKIDAIADLLRFEEERNNKQFDIVLDLDVTSPLRTVQDLEECFELLQSNNSALNIFSVSPASRNPYFNMVEDAGEGFVRLVKHGKAIKSRQEAPKVYDMNASFYFYRRSFFELGHRTATTDKSLAYEVKHECFDLDEPIDFKILEIMLKEGLLSFSL